MKVLVLATDGLRLSSPTVDIRKRILAGMCVSHQQGVSLENLTGGEVSLGEKSVNVSERRRKPEERRCLEIRQQSASLH